MSTSTTATLLGFPVTINKVPTTLDEAIESCGGGNIGTEKLLGKFVGYSNAHSTYNDGRSEIVTAVEKVTGIAQKVGAENEDDEKDSIYVARALHESGKTVADVIAAGEISVDFNPGTSGRRAGTPKTPSKTYVENATKIIDGHKDKPDTLAQIVKGLSALNPTASPIVLDEAGAPTVESLAAMLKSNNDRKLAEAKAELAALGV